MFCKKGLFTMNTMKLVMGVLAVLMGVGVTSADTATPAGVGSNLLSVAPAEAWGVIVINDLGKTSTILDEYAAKMGMEAPGIQRRISRMLGVSGQLNAGKPLMLVILNKETFGDQPVAVILSIKEFESFAAGFSAKATETPGMMKGENEELGQVYFTKKGTFLVMGPTEAIVNAVVNSKQGFATGMEAGSQKLMGNSDLYIRVNFQAVGQFLKPLLMGIGAMMQMGGMGGMGAMGGGEGTTTQGVNPQVQAQQAQMQAIGTMINAFVGLMDELNSLDIGFTMQPKAVQTSTLVNFKSGQDIANLLASQKQTDKSLLKGLPGKDFGIAMGWQWQPKMTKLQEAMLQITPPLSTPAEVEKFKALSKQAADLVTGQAFKVSMKPVKKGQSLLEVQAVIETKNAKQYLDVLKQTMELQSKVKMAVKGQELQAQYKYEPAVTKVGDVSVDQFTVDASKALNMPGLSSGGEADQVKGLLTTLMGDSGGLLKFKVAAVSDKLVVLEFGSDQGGLEQLIQTAKSGGTSLSSNTKLMAASKLLPKERFLEGYLDAGKMITTAMGITMNIGNEEGKPAEGTATSLPAVETPLVGFAGSIQGPTLRIDMIVPFEVMSQAAALRYMVPASLPSVGPLGK
jgi:hypothetical protein